MTEPERLPRKLAAILYGDVTGYSRLTAADEDSTHRRLSEYLDRFAATVRAHGGRVMHYAGDAVLAKFDAVLDALTCAAAVQRDLRARNADLPIERRVEFGIGVNLGDVIEDRGDIYGDGVNVAARLEGLAGAGEICVSEAVRTAVGKRLPLTFTDLGEQQLKNLDQPVHAYRVSVSAEASPEWPPSAVSLQARARPQSRRFDIKRRSIAYLSAAAAALTAAFLIATWRDNGTAGVAAPSAPAASAPSIKPLTFDGGQKDHARLSPDGELVAYTWNNGDDDGDGLGDFDIYVRPIGRDTAPIQVTTDAADFIAPAWSPDNRTLAFVRLELDGSSRASIHQAHAFGGGQTRQIVELPAFPVSEGRFIGWLAWSPDGKALVYGERAAAGVPARLVRLNLDTLEKSPVTTSPTPPDSVGDFAPSYSPDGTRVAFVRGGSGYNIFDVWIMDADGQGARQITTSQWAVIEGLGWAASGRDVLFTAGDLVSSRSYSVPISGGAPALLPGLGENDRGASATGERLVFTKFGPSLFYIWEVRGRLADDDPPAAPRRIRAGSNVVTSPSGDQIAWQTARTGKAQIWLAASDGSNERPLTDQRTSARVPQWSRDGRHIAFGSTDPGNNDVYVVEVSSGRVTQLTTDPNDDRNPSYSRDGRWLYFASNRSGAFEIYRMPSDGGEAARVTEGGGRSAYESYDERFLYYLSDMDEQGAATLFRLPIDGGEPTALFTAVLLEDARWFLTSEGIYYVDAGRRPTFFAVRYFDFATGAARPIYEDAAFIGDLTVSPDEKRVFISRRALPESELWLVENFR